MICIALNCIVAAASGATAASAITGSDGADDGDAKCMQV